MADTTTTPPRPSRPGGFMPPTSTQYARNLPSPAPSTASSRAAARLPAPRSKPLVPGSRKEDYARDYVSQRLLHIARRYVKKHGGAEEDEEEEDGDEDGGGGGKTRKKEPKVTGYENADQMCADLEEVVDVLWFSGTPSLQIPYLINVAHALTTYLVSFPPSPRPTFTLLQKLDHCFASLLVGRDVKTRAPLSGFASSLSASTTTAAAAAPLPGFSRTDMVRIKSIADETRRLVAVVMSGEADVENRDDYDERDNSDDDDDDDIGYSDAKPRCATGPAAAITDATDVSRLVKKEYRMLDPFQEQIDPGEGVVYKLKPAGADYGGFVADEETDDEEEQDRAAPVGVKKEDEDEAPVEDDEDGDGDEFVDVAQPAMIPKRKVDDDADLSDEDAEAADPKKRVKVKVEEQEGDATRKTTTTAVERQRPPPQLPSSTIPGGSGSVDVEDDDDDYEEEEEDDDDDDDGSETANTSRAPPRPPAYPTATTATPSQTDPAAGPTSGTQQFHFTLDDSEDSDSDHPAAPRDEDEQRREEQEQEQEDEEEEEELHMNVARVYEKTLVRLGKIMLEEERKDVLAGMRRESP